MDSKAAKAKSDDPGAVAGVEEARRRRVVEALRLWAGMTLGGVAVLGVVGMWYLRRRGRALRERLGPVRDVDWPEER